MLDSFLSSVIAVTLISLLSLIGVVAISLTERFLDEILFYLVSFAGGAILGAAYFDLMPEAIELIDMEEAIIYIALGFVTFYLLERIFYWYHGHGHAYGERVEISEADERAGVKSFTYLNLLGDGVHNLIDGMVIGAGFTLSTSAGVVTTLAVVFHELPQEIGDFAILVYGGLSKTKALAGNFLVSLTAIIGVIVAHFIFASDQMVGYLVGFAGGGFTYLSAAELIPEMQREKKTTRSALQFAIFIGAMLFILGLVRVLPE